MSFGARTPESACRHTGASWGRSDIHLPPCWTRAVQAYLPSDDCSAARSLFRHNRLMLALRDRMKNWRFLPHSPRSMTIVKRVKCLLKHKPGLGPQQAFLGVIIYESPCQLAEILAFIFTSIVFLSWQKSTAIHELPPPLPQPALKSQKEHRQTTQTCI